MKEGELLGTDRNQTMKEQNEKKMAPHFQSFQMTRRIIVSVRDRMQLGLDKLNIMARQFSGDTSQAVRNMTQESCCEIQDIHVYIS